MFTKKKMNQWSSLQNEIIMQELLKYQMQVP